MTWTANGVKLPFAENSYASESVVILRTKWSIAAVYEAHYKGIIGKVIQPVPSWAISLDKNGSRYYWSQTLHGETPGMFVCGLTECEELPSDSLALQLMQWYTSLAMYTRENPDAAAEFGHSTITPLNLKARLGIQG